MEEASSYPFSLCLPESITKETSSMVIELSAMLVDTTTLRTPRGGRLKTLRCSVVGSDPWQHRTGYIGG